MPAIIEQIQQDILDPKTSVSSILLKTKVLAYELKNLDLKQWVKNELDGYPDRNALPDYRIVHVSSSGTFIGYGFGSMMKATNLPMPVSILPEWLRDEVSTAWLQQGMRSLEEMGQSKHGVTWMWLAEWLSVFNQYHISEGAQVQCINASYSLSPYIFAQIVETVRSRLLDLILEIAGSPWYINNEPELPEHVQRLVEVIILNHPEGGKVSVFDQRNQQVSYQYNAAGNINVQAVQNQLQLVEELEKLKAEVQNAYASQAIDNNTATTASGQLTEAIYEANKSLPNKQSLVDRISTAKNVLENTAKVAGVVTALAKIIEVVDKIF